MKIKSTIKERIVSGIVYLSLFTPLAFVVGLFVYFVYGKKSKFMKFHATQAGFLLLLNWFLYLVAVYVENPILGTYGNFTPTNPILMFFSLMTNILTIVLAISAFTGKSYRITRIFDFLKK
jgi:uncharacterized membrane protein